jgi:hypothetical protein
MKNTTAAPVFIKANNSSGKLNVKTKRIVITDVDLYDEEEMIQLSGKGKLLKSSRNLINKDRRKDGTKI